MGEKDEMARTITKSKSYKERLGPYKPTLPQTNKVFEKSKHESYLQVQQLWNNFPQFTSNKASILCPHEPEKY